MDFPLFRLLLGWFAAFFLVGTANSATGNATVGQLVTFSATANGTLPFSYQWRKNNASIPGATAASFSIASVQLADAGTYSVVVSNSVGSTTSDNAILTVTAAGTAPVFTTQPASQTAAPGAAVTFTAAASGSPAPTYQWRKDSVNIAGATGSNYLIASVSSADTGTFSVVATNSAGSATSANASLTVTGASTSSAPVFSGQPSGQSMTAGQNATFTVTTTGGTPSSYQWQRLPAGSSTWENLSEGGSYRGVITATLTINSTTGAMSGDQFRCVTTNSAGSATSNAAALTVNASSSLLQYPAGIARDAAGNFYVADASSNTVQKITSAGVVSTLAGAAGAAGSQDGIGASARFNQPNGVALDAAGNLYVADTGNATIRKISADGTVITLAGSPASRGSRDGAGSDALFNQPSGLAVDGAGNLYVADTYNATIRKITPAGTVSTLAGLAGSRGEADGSGTAARFNYPSGLAVDGTGNLYVADTYNATIRKVSPSGMVTTLAGSAGIIGAVDLTGTNALFNQPWGIAVDAAGNVYVADTGSAIIRRISAGGAVSTLAGVAGVAGFADGPGPSALFNQPHGLVLDGSGNLFVADTANAAIRRVASDATVTTLALTAPQSSTTPPPPSNNPAPSGYTPPPASGTASGGGGGGAIGAWFVAVLLLLGMSRWAVGRHQS